MAKAKGKYKEIIGKLPRFEKGDRFQMNIIGCAMLAAVVLSMPERPDVEKLKGYYRNSMMTGAMKWFCRMSGKKKFTQKDIDSMKKTAAFRAADRNPYLWNMDFLPYADNSGYIQMALGNCFQMLFPVPIIFVVSLILAFRIDSLMGLILLGVLTVISVICTFIMCSTAPMFRKLQKKLDRMSKVLLENITGVRVIRAFNKENHEEQRLNGEFRSYAKTAIKVNKRFAILDNISFFAVNMFVIIVYYLSGARITAGYFEIGDITAIIEYAMLALFYLMMAQMVILTLPRALECCNRIGEILDFAPTIADKTVARVPEKEGSKDVLSFQNVSFRFADADEYTLNNLNFTCKRGETTAIIGGTGSGKSTVASLMMRFNEVTDGKILLNGVDIRQMPQYQLREHCLLFSSEHGFFRVPFVKICVTEIRMLQTKNCGMYLQLHRQRIL